MRYILIAIFALTISLFAEVINKPIDKAMLDTGIPIVDIRTPGEWRQTGLVQGAIPIMFYDERGGYDLKGFLDELNAKVDTSKEFALICRTGSRTRILANYLSHELGYKVVDISGGIMNGMRNNIPLEPYTAK